VTQFPKRSYGEGQSGRNCQCCVRPLADGAADITGKTGGTITHVARGFSHLLHDAFGALAHVAAVIIRRTGQSHDTFPWVKHCLDHLTLRQERRSVVSVQHHTAMSRQDNLRRHAVGRMSFDVSFQLFFRSARFG
jgi:hypothetical protein